jgi:hypothetical protein
VSKWNVELANGNKHQVQADYIEVTTGGVLVFRKETGKAYEPMAVSLALSPSTWCCIERVPDE